MLIFINFGSFWYVNFLYCIVFMLALTVSSYSPMKEACQASLNRLSDFFYSIIKTEQYDDVWWHFNASTTICCARQLVTSQNVKFIALSRLTRALTLFTSELFFLSEQSQSSTLAMAIKNLWLTFYVFFTAYFSKCMLNKHPRRVIRLVSVLLVHIMFILMAIRIIQVLFPTLRLFACCNRSFMPLRRSRLISHRNLRSLFINPTEILRSLFAGDFFFSLFSRDFLS